MIKKDLYAQITPKRPGTGKNVCSWIGIRNSIRFFSRYSLRFSCFSRCLPYGSPVRDDGSCTIHGSNQTVAAGDPPATHEWYYLFFPLRSGGSRNRLTPKRPAPVPGYHKRCQPCSRLIREESPGSILFLPIREPEPVSPE